MNPIGTDVLGLVRQFWDAVDVTSPGAEQRFPRHLETAISAALPLAIVSLRNLRTSTVVGWLAHLAVNTRDFGPDRPLRGCLVAFAGRGVIFADGGDSPGETQLTLAHETAHFLHHYVAPRERAIARIGPTIVEVLDGARAPTNEERLAGVLRGCPIGQFRHMMVRGQEGSVLHADLERAETEADLIALELLAPAKAVASSCRRYKGQVDEAIALDVLENEYELPPWAAKLQAQVVARRYSRRRSAWLDGLGKLARNQSPN